MKEINSVEIPSAESLRAQLEDIREAKKQKLMESIAPLIAEAVKNILDSVKEGGSGVAFIGASSDGGGERVTGTEITSQQAQEIERLFKLRGTTSFGVTGEGGPE